MKTFSSLIATFVTCGVLFGQTSQLTISWDPNPEPNIAYYQLQRSVNSTTEFVDFVQVSHPEIEVVDEDVEPGNLYSFRISAVDEDGVASAFSTPVTVGIPQILLALGNVRSEQDTSFSMSPHVYDPDNIPGEFTFEIVTQSNVAVTVINGEMTLTPVPQQYVGPATFELLVEDPDGLSTTKSISFEFVEPFSPQLIVSIPDQTFAEGGAHQLWMDTLATVEGFSVSDLNWSFSFTSAFVTEYDGSSRILDISTVDPDWNGQAYAIASATAPTNVSDSDTFWVSVSSVNDAPVLTLAEIEVDDNEPATIVDLSTYATDIDHDSNDLAWYFWGFSSFDVSWLDEQQDQVQIVHTGSEISESGYFAVQDPLGAADTALVTLTAIGGSVGFAVDIPDVTMMSSELFSIFMDSCVTVSGFSAEELTWQFRSRRFMNNVYDSETRIYTIEILRQGRSGTTNMVAIATAPDQTAISDTFMVTVVASSSRSGAEIAENSKQTAEKTSGEEIEAPLQLESLSVHPDFKQKGIMIELELESPSVVELKYGLDTNPKLIAFNSEYRHDHVFNLTELVPDTIYSFDLVATDDEGRVLSIRDSTFRTDGLIASLDAEDFVVYPNPLKAAAGHDEVIFRNIPESTQNLSLYSVAGERVYEEEVDGIQRHEYRLRVTDENLRLGSGLYIYVLKDNHARVLKRGKFTVIN